MESESEDYFNIANVFFSLLLSLSSIFREFYARNKNSDELKIKDLDEVDSGYFAVEFNNQWHRVEPYDTRMGEAVRVSMLFFAFGLIVFLAISTILNF